MKSKNMYVLTILGCVIIIVTMFFSLSLDKIVIKPLIRNYVKPNMQIKLEQSKSLTLMTSHISEGVI